MALIKNFDFTTAGLIVFVIAAWIWFGVLIGQGQTQIHEPEVTINGDWVIIDQTPYRTIHVKQSAITGVVSTVSHISSNKPAAAVIVGAKEYRLDFATVANAEAFALLVTSKL